MILGNKDSFHGFGCVCFIDILGFSNEILKNWNNPEADPLKKILSVKEKMPTTPPNISAQEKNSPARKYVCRVTTVSDSVTICFGYDTQKTLSVGDFILGLEALIANITYTWSTFIKEGFTIRGAIDIGDIYWDTNELIGPAFINAYRLESEVAKTSRIIISPRLNKELKNLADNYQSTLTDHLFKNFTKDSDGYIIINPNLMHNDTSEQRDIIAKLEEMKLSVPNGIVREKYTTLIYLLKEGNKSGVRKEDLGNY